MSDNIKRLRERQSEERAECGGRRPARDFEAWREACALTDAALAAVEQEIAELRKRPTLEEVLSRLDPTDLPGDSEDCAPLWDAAIGRIRALYAEKGATP